MAYNTFIPTVWAETINRELERLHVLALHTNRDYEGQVKKKGDSVRILNVGKPTVYKIDLSTNRDDLYSGLNAPETVEGSSITMPINQVAYFNYAISDIDEAQAAGNITGALQAETSEVLKQDVDVYLGQTVFASVPLSATSLSDSTYKYTKITSGDTDAGEAKVQNALDLIDDLVELAQKNNISDATPMFLNCSPTFWKYVKKSFAKISTNNVKELNGREYAVYNGVTIEWSNNVKKATINSKTCEYVTLRTARAVAYVHPMTHTEAFRPEKGFTDAVKGFILYDAAVIRPKEIFNAAVYY